jgi:hypothetical protein
MAGQPSTPEVAERGQGSRFVPEPDISRCPSINSSARGRNDSEMVRGAAFSGQDEGTRRCSIAPIFGPHLRFVGYPTPCFGDRLKLTDLVYRAVSPLSLDMPMRHVGRFDLSRLEHRSRILGQDSRHANSPLLPRNEALHFVIEIPSASIKLEKYPPIFGGYFRARARQVLLDCAGRRILLAPAIGSDLSADSPVLLP